MPHCFPSHASCMSSPRFSRRRTADSGEILPAATSAVYSPTEFPIACVKGGVVSLDEVYYDSRKYF